MNVYSLFNNAARAWGERSAVRCGALRQTYQELARASAAFNTRLAALGLKPGDRVALYMNNGLPYPAALLGALRGGYVAVPINAKLHPREAAYIVDNAEIAALVADDHKREIFKFAGFDRSATFIAGDKTLLGPDGADAFEAVGDIGQVAACEPDDAAWLFYTSGTTGRPKGAVLSHRNLIAMAVNCLADICAFRPDDRLLHAAPLSHGSGFYLIPALARGAENIIDGGPSFDADRILRFIASESVTVLPFLAPTMIVRLLDGDPSLRTPNLRAIVYGGAPIHVEHLRAAIARFGPVLTQLYGQGEAPMTISGLPAWSLDGADDSVLKSAGFPRTGVEIRIFDADGGEMLDGGVGEIAVRGDVVMRGYWRNEAANAAAFQNGWLKTGDIGRFDEGGRLLILDRRHDMIISGGSNVYPREVEDVLTQHPAVKEAVVYGLPDREWGESVAAAIVLRDGFAELTSEELVAFCQEHLARFKKPKIITFVPELPTNAYGKVLRKILQV